MPNFVTVFSTVLTYFIQIFRKLPTCFCIIQPCSLFSLLVTVMSTSRMHFLPVPSESLLCSSLVLGTLCCTICTITICEVESFKNSNTENQLVACCEKLCISSFYFFFTARPLIRSSNVARLNDKVFHGRVLRKSPSSITMSECEVNWSLQHIAVSKGPVQHLKGSDHKWQATFLL